MGTETTWRESYDKLPGEFRGALPAEFHAAARREVERREQEWADQFPGGPEPVSMRVTGDPVGVLIWDIGVMADEYGDITLSRQTALELADALRAAATEAAAKAGNERWLSKAELDLLGRASSAAR